MSLIIKKIVLGSLSTNCYILSCENSGNTFIIDPEENPKPIIDYIFRNEFVPKGIILTHGHPDHLKGVKTLKGELGIWLAMHTDDVPMAKLMRINTIDKILKDGDILNLGRPQFKVIHTPGHSPGSICLYGEGVLFSGDTLFNSGVGRTDLPGGSSQALEESLINKIFTLPDETIVYPGHGPETTIAREKI